MRTLPVVGVTAFLALACTAPGRAQMGSGDKCSLSPAVKAVLEAADEIEVLSLDPNAKREGAKAVIHGFVVLGSTKATKESQARVFKEVSAAVEATTYGEIALCFSPRHALRAKIELITVELVICFECSQVKVYWNGEGGGSEAIKEGPQKYLDELLTAAKVPLAAKPGTKK